MAYKCKELQLLTSCKACQAVDWHKQLNKDREVQLLTCYITKQAMAP